MLERFISNPRLMWSWIRSLVRNVAMFARDGWVSALILSTLAMLLHDAFTAKTILLLLAIVAGYIAAFIINDYYDAPLDAADPAKAQRNPFVHHSVSLVWVRGALVGLAALFLATFQPFGSKGVMILLLAVTVMWGYSAPPLRLKSRPGLDLLTHAVFMYTFPYWMCLILIGAAWTSLDYVILTLAFLSSVTAQLEQQARDFELDARTDTNFTTTFGLSTTVTLLKIGSLAGYVVFVLGAITRVLPVFLLPFGLIFLPGMAHRFLRRAETPRSERLVTITKVVGMLYVGLLLVFLVS